MRSAIPRLFAALPDAITASVFLVAWTAPAQLGPDSVRNLTLVMLIEFIVLHSSVFYAVIVAADGVARGKRILWLSGLSALYLTFVLGFSLAFSSSWPLFAFGWLFVSRFLHIWTRKSEGIDAGRSMTTIWAAGVGAYLLGAFATVMLPLPPLGITPEFIESMHLTGSGEWIDRPYTVLAFGAFYFAVQAWVKYAVSGAASPAAAAVEDSAPPSPFVQRLGRLAVALRERRRS